MKENSWQVNDKSLSKKYRTDVGRLIKAWKKGLSDDEIVKKTGIKQSTLYLIKHDIELAHRRIRLARKKREPAGLQPPGRRQIFFNPDL
ncbi:MAG TPA: hypothetical protein PK728_03300 [Bacillota bacterium]|nr:hypothetical protein [Bacillota bacterium]